MSRLAGFLVRRLVAAVPTVWGVLTAVFLLTAALPGRPFVEGTEGQPRPEAAARLRALYGTDRPLGERYARWLRGAVTGDLGISYAHGRPVADLLLEAMGNTALLASLAIFVQLVAGAAAGVMAARSGGGLVDRTITWGAGIASSIPSFLAGMILIWVVSVKLRWLPASQMHGVDPVAGLPRLLDTLRHLALPCLALALPGAGGIALYAREELAGALGAACVRAARARGIGASSLVLRHALGNALLPLIVLLGLALPGIAGGSVVVEVLFAWPGMGRLLYQAVLARDVPLLAGGTCVVSALVILGSLVADLLAAAVDPRVREATW